MRKNWGVTRFITSVFVSRGGVCAGCWNVNANVQRSEGTPTLGGTRHPNTWSVERRVGGVSLSAGRLSPWERALRTLGSAAQSV